MQTALVFMPICRLVVFFLVIIAIIENYDSRWNLIVIHIWVAYIGEKGNEISIYK